MGEKIKAYQKQIDKIIEESYSHDKVQLKGITKIESGGTPKKNDPEYWTNGSINWVTIEDTKAVKYLKSTRRKITEKALKESSTKVLPINTVLFSSRATIGYPCIAKIEACTNQGYKNFICDEENLHYEFLYYILNKESKNIEESSVGTTYKEVSKKYMGNYQIPLPPLETQKEMISQTRDIESKIDKLKSSLHIIPDKKKAILDSCLNIS